MGHITEPFSTSVDCVIGQVGDPGTTGVPSYQTLCRQLARHYGGAHPVYVTGSHLAHPGRQTEATCVADLAGVLERFEKYVYVVVVPRRYASRR